ncbi:hypothetical protein Ancab_004532 [Ancistrocladus abbreviatus]
MATLEAISEAIQQIDAKKENLRKAFEDLQKLSHSLSSSFSLNWTDIDSYISTIHSSLLSKFSLLHDKEQQHLKALQENPSSQIPQKPKKRKIDNNNESSSISSIELREICEKMEPIKLRNWLKQNDDRKFDIPTEIKENLKFAPDPAKLVLDAIDGFAGPGRESGDENVIGDRNCMFLLEGLMEVEGFSISGEVTERAKNLAVEWKGKLKKDAPVVFEALLFLQLLCSFRLGEEFDKDDLLDFVTLILLHRKGYRQLKQAATLCQVLGLEDKVPEIVQSVSRMGRQLLVIRFVNELKLTDKCPPVPLLKSYLGDAQKQAKQIRKRRKRLLASGATDSVLAAKLLVEAAQKELEALKTVLNFVKEHNLEPEYPLEVIENRIKGLEEQKEKQKHAAHPKVPKPKGPKWQKMNMRPKPKLKQHTGCGHALSNVPAAAFVPVVSSSLPPFQHSNLHSAGLLVEHSAVLTSPAGPYGLAGSASTMDPYVGSVNRVYGLSSIPGYAGNLSSVESHMYASGSHLPSSLYDRPTPLAGYGIPSQHNP